MWGCMALWMIASVVPTSVYLNRFIHQNGWPGVNARPWRETDAYAKLREWPYGGGFWAAEPAAVHFASHCLTRRLPSAKGIHSNPVLSQRARDLARTYLAQGPLFVVYMKNMTNRRWNTNFADPKTMSELVRLRPVWRASDDSARVFQVTGVLDPSPAKN